MAVEDRRQLLEQHARFYARHGFAVVFTRGLEGDLAKRVTDPGWEKTPPLPDSNGGDYAAGLIGTRALTRNIGITLRSSNLIGVEADSPELIDRVHELELPATLTEQTRGPERRHWYFRPPANLNGALEVVSFRFEGDTVVPATNNYYVCAPSIHPVTGGVYTILDDGLELETIPELPLGKLVELMTLAGRTLHGRKTGKPRAARVAGTVPVGRRHETLTSLAGTMNRRGMSADAIEAALQVEDATLFDEPVGERDVRAIAESVTGRYEPVQPVEVLSGFEKTDVGNGQLFAAAQQGRLRYVWDEETWIEWRDGRWRRDTSGAAVRAAKAVTREMLRQASKIDDDAARKTAVSWALLSETRGRLNAMLAMAGSEQGIVVTGAELDTNPYLLSCGNGAVDLRTGELREPDPADLITLGTDVNYVHGAPRPRWEQFLEEVFDADEDLIAFVKRFYGSCATGDTRDRVIAIEYGRRFNGKTTLNRAIQDVLGDFAHTAPIRVVMRSRQSEIPNEIAALARKRFVVVAETADGHKLDENRVKMLTGNDEIAARQLYREWFTFRPEYKLVLYTNFKPRVDGADGAVWDRIRLIPFNVSFDGREDKALASKLRAEREGILAWLVEGCLEWQEDGLGSCDAVDRGTASYRTENDTIGRFVGECCELGDDFRVIRRGLRSALKTFCEEGGDDEPPATTLGRWLVERGVRETRVDGKRAYRGIRLAGEET